MKDTGLEWLTLSELIYSLKYKGGKFFTNNTGFPVRIEHE